MLTKNSNFNNYINYIAIGLIIASLWPWFSIYMAQVINSDIAFLTLSAGRLLAGETMSGAFYDTNPPLSILVQIPTVILSKVFNIPIYYAVSAYIFSLLVLSLTATNYLLRLIPDISNEQRTLIICALLITNTVVIGYDFGQKDHILGMALFPFVLVQILITMRIDMNSFLKWGGLIAGSLLILLKPHYGLIPASILLHRAIYQCRITVFKDIDFICLSLMAIIYVVIIYIFFNDFITIILPDTLKYYVSDLSTSIIYTGIVLTIMSLLCAYISLYIFKDLPKITAALFIISALCIIPFIMQGKGWVYHLLPAISIFTAAFSILSNRLVRLVLIELKIKKNLNISSFIITFIPMVMLVIYNGNTNYNNPTHKGYLDSELVTIINECEGKCSFAILHNMINIPHELSIYTNQSHASRFPIMWFIPYLLNAQHMIDTGNNNILMTQDEINDATLRYTNMVAQDFKKYKPAIIFVGHFPSLIKKGELFNIRDYLLEKNNDFKNIWNDYKFERTISIDRIEYMIGKLPNEELINYDIYKRIKTVTKDNDDE